MSSITISIDLPVSKEALRAFENSNVQEYIKEEIEEIMLKGLQQLVKYGDINHMIIEMCEDAIQDQMDEVGIQAITDKIVKQLNEQDYKLPSSLDSEVYQIVHARHCGHGYFSWDGMLEDLGELIGDEKLASEVLRNV